MTHKPETITAHVEGPADPTMPEYRQDLPCPDHPTAAIETGFGMAGGGMGIYAYCVECGKIISKSQTE